MRSTIFDDGTFDYFDHSETTPRTSKPCVSLFDRPTRELRPTIDESLSTAGNTFPNNPYHLTPLLRTPVRTLGIKSRKPFFSLKDRQHIRNALD